MTDRSRFKSSQGQYLLKALFFEEVGADKSSVVYTLKQEDHLGFPSLYRLYMEAGDPTEYRFAVTNLFGWQHWETLSECTWFRPVVAQWRRELDVKVRAEALLQIKDIALSAQPSAFQANKYLLDGHWKAAGEVKHGRGRPSKDQIKEAASELARASQEANEDFSRITSRTQ